MCQTKNSSSLRCVWTVARPSRALSGWEPPGGTTHEIEFSPLKNYKLSFSGATQLGMGYFCTHQYSSNNVGYLTFEDTIGFEGDARGSSRMVYVSETPCGIDTAVMSQGPRVGLTLWFTVGGSVQHTTTLKPNTLYYLHILYRSTTGSLCTSGRNCATLFDIKAPKAP